MASRSLQDLHPDMQILARKFLAACAASNETLAEGVTPLNPLIYVTYRSNKEQDELYKQGRTVAGKIVTNAKGGQSKHNCTNPDGSPASQAFDCANAPNGSIDWYGRDNAWQRMGEIGEKIGLSWGGSWKTFKDRPHFELKGK